MNPDEELKRALDNLEAFSEAAAKKGTPFEKVSDLVQTLFSSSYNKKKAEIKAQVKLELIKSIRFIKTYFPLIDRYREGTPEQRKLAELAICTIEKYNRSLIPSDDFSDLKIEEMAKVQTFKSGAIDDFFKGQKISEEHLLPSERDTLKMKAIRLIENHGGSELAQDLNKHSELSKLEREGKEIILMQTFSELPGEVTRILGAFRRENVHSIPIKDSFKIYLESIQPGHPYPMQHMGFSLSHWIVPSTLLWIDQAPLLKPIIERKKQAALDLLPKGSKNSKARRLYRFKKNHFDERKLEYLSFHKELSHSLIKAHPLTDDSHHEIVSSFFNHLESLDNPSDILSKTHETLNRHYIDQPFEKMEELRFSLSLDDDRSKREEILRSNYKKARQCSIDCESPIKEYLELMGKIIGDSAEKLLTLQISEKVKIKPPVLSDFDLKIQAASIKHLLEFLDELDSEIEQDKLIEQMRAQIHSEIELFMSPSFEEINPLLQELVEEIVSYYHAQFHTAS